MAGALRLTKAERELIKAAVECFGGDSAKERKARDSILTKLELAELPVKKGTYLTVNDAIAAFKEVLGPRLLAPRFEARGVLGRMKNRIQALGLTRQDCVSIAKVASVQWAGIIRAESLVRQADKLLVEAQQPMPFDKETMPGQRTPQTKTASPVELGDEEI